MSYGIIILLLYIFVVVGFFAAIQFERIKQNAQFNIFQVIVALFWPVWGVWYLWVLAKDAWQNRK